MKVKSKPCANPECNEMFTPKYSTLEKYCSNDCKYKCIKPKKIDFTKLNNKKKDQKKKPIKQVSAKRSKENRIYTAKRIVFLMKPDNEICFIDDCFKPSTTIEHRMGRKGFADDYARENNISLFLDERFWAGCCNEHNIQLENDSELSKKYQLSKIHGGKKM